MTTRPAIAFQHTFGTQRASCGESAHFLFAVLSPSSHRNKADVEAWKIGAEPEISVGFWRKRRKKTTKTLLPCEKDFCSLKYGKMNFTIENYYRWLASRGDYWRQQKATIRIQLLCRSRQSSAKKFSWLVNVLLVYFQHFQVIVVCSDATKLSLELKPSRDQWFAGTFFSSPPVWNFLTARAQQKCFKKTTRKKEAFTLIMLELYNGFSAFIFSSSLLNEFNDL